MKKGKLIRYFRDHPDWEITFSDSRGELVDMTQNLGGVKWYAAAINRPANVHFNFNYQSSHHSYWFIEVLNGEGSAFINGGAQTFDRMAQGASSLKKYLEYVKCQNELIKFKQLLG
jgi:hypothetical protein